MNKLDRMLIASPLEFAEIFGEVTSDATTEALTGTMGAHQGAVALATLGSARSLPAERVSVALDTPVDEVGRP